MKTLQTTAKITANGQLTIDIPVHMPPGEYQVVLVVEERPLSEAKRSLADFPVHSVGSWPSHLSLRREDMYGDDGR